MRMIGYARVSTQQQDTALQMTAFERFGVKRVHQEKRGGGSGVARPVLEHVLHKLRPDDVLVVYKIDRLARSLSDLLKILERVTAAGASFKSLTEPLETQTPVGRMMLQLLGAVAEFEREVIRERCAAGIVDAKRRGVRFGKPVQFERADVQRLLDDGYGITDVAGILGCCRSSVYRLRNGIRVVDGGPGEHALRPSVP